MSPRGSLRAALLAAALLAACRAGAPPGAGAPGPAPARAAPDGPAAGADSALVLLPGGGRRVVEVAADPEARRIGLMFRDSLPPDGGMLLVFEEPGPHAIWMKNCRFPLDLLWLDASGTILALEESAPPCPEEPCRSYAPAASALKVLELEGGAARREGLRVGARLRIVPLAPAKRP